MTTALPIASHQASGKSLAIVIVLFKLSWFSLVVFRNQGLGPAMVFLSLMLIMSKPDMRGLLALLLVVLTGLATDSALTLLEVFSFDPVPALVLPAWLILLWFSLATLIVHTWHRLSSLGITLFASVGMLAGIVGYGAGHLLGAVEFTRPLWFTMFMIGLAWVTLPLLWYAGLTRCMPRLA